MEVLSSLFFWAYVSVFASTAAYLIYEMSFMYVEGGKYSIGLYISMLIAMFIMVFRSFFDISEYKEFNLVVFLIIFIPHVVKFVFQLRDGSEGGEESGDLED